MLTPLILRWFGRLAEVYLIVLPPALGESAACVSLPNFSRTYTIFYVFSGTTRGLIVWYACYRTAAAANSRAGQMPRSDIYLHNMYIRTAAHWFAKKGSYLLILCCIRVIIIYIYRLSIYSVVNKYHGVDVLWIHVILHNIKWIVMVCSPHYKITKTYSRSVKSVFFFNFSLQLYRFLVIIILQ